MEEIKEAFSRVKQDIDFLYFELNEIKIDLRKTQELMIELGEIIKVERKNSEMSNFNRQTNQQTSNISFPTQTPNNSTGKLSFNPLKPQNQRVSTRNEGVPTDRQTDRQTNQQTDLSSYNPEKLSKDDFSDAIEALDSLDNVKKEIRLKFKKLTEQEMKIFSLLYQLTEEYGFSDYKTLSQKLILTESSIRDYIGRLIKKGIPVEKNKINNKTIQLKISENLKKIVSLQTILQLRGI